MLANDRAKTWIENFSYAQMNKFNWVDRQRCFASPGCNGPYFALETPVRNTCHWLVTFLILNTWLKDKEVLRHIEGMRRWLLDDNAYYVGCGVFKIRQQPGLDICNGVIGPAWVLESLARLDRYLEDSKAYVLAHRVIKQLKFSRKFGMWQRSDPLNNNYRIDYTYDHQAWLAAAITDVGGFEEPRLFLDKTAEGLMRLRADGRIRHIAYANSVRGILARMAFARREHTAYQDIEVVEKSYHHYVLFPLARMKNRFEYHTLYNSSLLKHATGYLNSINIDELSNYPLCVSYNAPGFEFPMLALVLGEHANNFSKKLQKVMDWQQLHTFNDDHNACLNAADPLTLTARIYELALFVEAHNEMCNVNPE